MRCWMLLSLPLFSITGGRTATADDDAKISFNNLCRSCHSIHPGDNRLGPSVHRIFGSEAVAGFGGYSGGLTGLVWDENTLERLIADRVAVSSSTNMIYPPSQTLWKGTKSSSY